MNHEILEVKRTGGGKVAPSANIIFDTVLKNTENINFDIATGVLSFQKVGQYVAEWWVATDTVRRGAMQFALKTSVGDRIIGSSPAKRGQVTGYGVINVETVGVTASLINISGDAVVLSPTVAQTAFLVVSRMPDSGAVGPAGPKGETGANGVTPHIDAASGNWFLGTVDTGIAARGAPGPVAATIPFSLCKDSATLATDAQGNPELIMFSGFGSTHYDSSIYLQDGEWTAGVFTLSEHAQMAACFIMPRNAVVRKIHTLFATSNEVEFEKGATARPFVCLAVSNGENVQFKILQDSITHTAPYEGGMEYPIHTLRKGASGNLNIEIAEGSVVAIVTGLQAENATNEQYGAFTINGGLYLE